MTDVQLGWIAGILDGEGTITANETRILVSVGSTTLEMLKELQRLCGGSIRSNGKPQKPNHRSAWSWTLHGKNAFPLLDLIKDHLIIKKNQAFLALTMQRFYYKKNMEAREAAQKLAETLRWLNRKGPRWT